MATATREPGSRTARMGSASSRARPRRRSPRARACLRRSWPGPADASAAQLRVGAAGGTARVTLSAACKVAGEGAGGRLVAAVEPLRAERQVRAAAEWAALGLGRRERVRLEQQRRRRGREVRAAVERHLHGVRARRESGRRAPHAPELCSKDVEGACGHLRGRAAGAHEAARHEGHHAIGHRHGRINLERVPTLPGRARGRHAVQHHRRVNKEGQSAAIAGGGEAAALDRDVHAQQRRLRVCWPPSELTPARAHAREHRRARATPPLRAARRAARGALSGSA